ncbi:hypothetical protein J31TS3_54890 [Paenibacillus lactis]|nr:hypothetical protein J31TS3_54890 [Paenibacillus lactis]
MRSEEGTCFIAKSSLSGIRNSKKRAFFLGRAMGWGMLQPGGKNRYRALGVPEESTGIYLAFADRLVVSFH